jgi:hypothetical protein
MSRLVFLSFVLFVGSVPLWSQVEPSATGGGADTGDDSLMTLPPAVSGAFYPAGVASQDRSNFLSGGVITIAAYNDNVLTAQSAKPVSAESYEILPTIRLDERTARLHESLSYSPGFTFYDPTSELNQVTQNAIGDIQYRLTPHTTVGAEEIFQQNSTVFSEPYTVAGATITGSPDSFSPIVIAPYAGQIMDTTSGHIGYQFSRSSMIGASGSFYLFDYSNSSQNSALTEGLYNSDSGNGSGFYTHRLSRSQYIGLSYRYSVSVTTPYASTTRSQYGQAFYSVALGKEFSLSITGGPEYSTTSAPGVTPIGTWAPSGVASINWHRERANFALSYARAVTTGWGLLGAATTDNANAAFQYRFTRRLLGALNGNYANTKNATPLIATYTTTGHFIFGRASLSYRMGEHVDVVGEYSRLREDYFGIGAVSNDPNADRVSITLNYRFQKPLGR